MGVRLLADGVETSVWHGRDTERFTATVHPLFDVAGKTLQLELFDSESDVWNHVMLDYVMLARREAARNRESEERP